MFTNASLGWPAITSVNLPSGGPPLAALGARLRANLTDNWTVSAAIFDGDAAGPGSNDPQLRDNQGEIDVAPVILIGKPNGITLEVQVGATIGSVESDPKLDHVPLSRHQNLGLGSP